MFQSIRWRIAIPYLILIVLAMGVLSIYLSNWVRQSHRDDLKSKLTAEANLIADSVRASAEWDNPGDKFDTLAQHYADLLNARVTFIAADGTVLGESHEDRKEMDNHLQRPEVQEALSSGQGRSLRYSRTMGYEMMYAAVAIGTERPLRGFVHVALPVSQIQAQVARMRRVVLLAALLTVAGAALVALILAERIALPLRRLTNVVQRMAEGDLSARLTPTTQDEIGTLTRAFNHMSSRFQHTIDSLAEERRRLSAILVNMADGVIITDGRGRVRLINPAAVDLLKVDEKEVQGRSFARVTRDHRIIDLWQKCQKYREEQVAPVELDRREAFLQVIATPLQDGDSQACLVIVQDLTRIRRLETIRRDFVSNISHELRTPMASLKALVDTLRDSALQDPPAAERFLDRMDTEVDALVQMVRELLELSRIESGQVPFQKEPARAAEFVLPPVDRLRAQAERADLQLVVDLPSDLPLILADAGRLQQVFTNLVHNSIKFTPEGGEILVSGSRVHVSADGDIHPQTFNLKPDDLSPGDWVLITVEDTGVGIPSDDLPRIFERFYKAGQTPNTGTGLGLAIAKHVVQGHGGEIWAESVEGEGSTFYVAIPALTSR